MRNRFWLTLVVVALIGGSGVRVGADEPTDNARRVSVTLDLNVSEYDPTRPSEGILKGTVRNSTLEPIVVPVGYDGKQVQLLSGNLTLPGK